jgi:NAD(P)-dependent dehydrogenase (short-subunit alcohol dehydrogenase family)/acyl carrier protein
MQLLVATECIQEITGSENLKPDNAIILGPCRVMPQELSNLICRTIDLESVNIKHVGLYADFILKESIQPEREYSVAYRGRHRWVSLYNKIDRTENGKVKLREKGTYLITGGLGRIGLTFARFLADKYHANLILVNRSTVPEKSEWQTYHSQNQKDVTWYRVGQLLEIEKSANTLKIFSIDAANTSEMQKLIEYIYSEFNNLNGVIHAAGTLGESMVGLVSQVTKEDLDSQLHSKLEATKTLDKVLQGKDLDFVILQSSLSTVLGGLGFTAYSAANHYLDAFCQAKQSEKQNWLCVNWDGWRFEAAEGRKGSTNITDYSIYPEEGIEVLVKLLGSIISPRIVVSTGNLGRRIKKWLIGRKQGNEDNFDPNQLKHDRPNLPTPYIEPNTDLEKEISQTWQRLLGIGKIGVNDDFFDLGGNSLLGTQLIAQLRQKFQVELPIRVLFEDPTISGVSKIIDEQKQENTPGQDLLADMLSKIENMSDEQIKTKLQDAKNKKN